MHNLWWRWRHDYASSSLACISRSSSSRSIAIFEETRTHWHARADVCTHVFTHGGRATNFESSSRLCAVHTHRTYAPRLFIHGSYTGTRLSVFTGLCRKWQHVIRVIAGNKRQISSYFFPIFVRPTFSVNRWKTAITIFIKQRRMTLLIIDDCLAQITRIMHTDTRCAKILDCNSHGRLLEQFRVFVFNMWR